MPKVRRLNKFSSASSPSTPSNNPPTKAGISSTSDKDGANENQLLSRGQRKRMAKREQYLKREQMILSTLQLKKIDDQKSKLDGMDAIKEALTKAMSKNRGISRQKSPTSESTSNVITRTNKGKRDVAQREIPHLNLVLQHPKFQADPFSTMQEHLRNSVAEQKTCLEQQTEKQRKCDEKKTQERKEEKKERIRDMKYQRGRRGYNRRRT